VHGEHVGYDGARWGFVDYGGSGLDGDSVLRAELRRVLRLLPVDSGLDGAGVM
jgi:hypothetical protein